MRVLNLVAKRKDDAVNTVDLLRNLFGGLEQQVPARLLL